jgi:hypothetical protein
VERKEEFDCIGITVSTTFYEDVTVDRQLKYGSRFANHFWLWGDLEEVFNLVCDLN